MPSSEDEVPTRPNLLVIENNQHDSGSVNTKHITANAAEVGQTFNGNIQSSTSVTFSNGGSLQINFGSQSPASEGATPTNMGLNINSPQESSNIPDPIIPQELEDVSRKVEKELKDAIESFMSKGHAALAPRGGASQS